MSSKAAPYPENVREIVGVLAMMEHVGNAKAVGAVVLEANGDVRVLIAANDQQKLVLLGATVLLQNSLLKTVTLADKALEP